MASDYEVILERLCAHLQRIAGPGTNIKPEANLIDELALDSMKVMNMVMEIEDEFDISIPINSLADVYTVEELARLIERLHPEI